MAIFQSYLCKNGSGRGKGQKYVTKKKIKRLERQLIVSLDGNKHTLRCGATVVSAYLATLSLRLSRDRHRPSSCF